MIYLSTLGPRDDSLDIKPHFSDGIAKSVPCRPDFLFTGQWVEGKRVSVCGERKKPSDLCSSMADGSLVHKFRLGVEEGNRFQFLVVEGLVRCGKERLVEVRRGREWGPVIPSTDYHRYQSFLLQLQYYAGIHVIHTTGPKGTASEVEALFTMFQQDPHEHGSLLSFPRDALPDLGIFERPSLTRLWAKDLPGVGWKRSKSVADHAGMPEVLVSMTEKQWLEIDGIGKVLAKKIREAIHGST